METQEIRKYPVGMQTFVDIINDNYICRQNSNNYDSVSIKPLSILL